MSHNEDINSIGDCGLLGGIPDILWKTSLEVLSSLSQISLIRDWKYWVFYITLFNMWF
jgi:hypothetical protein